MRRQTRAQPAHTHPSRGQNAGYPWENNHEAEAARRERETAAFFAARRDAEAADRRRRAAFINSRLKQEQVRAARMKEEKEEDAVDKDERLKERAKRVYEKRRSDWEEITKKYEKKQELAKQTTERLRAELSPLEDAFASSVTIESTEDVDKKKYELHLHLKKMQQRRAKWEDKRDFIELDHREECQSIASEALRNLNDIPVGLIDEEYRTRITAYWNTLLIWAVQEFPSQQWREVAREACADFFPPLTVNVDIRCLHGDTITRSGDDWHWRYEVQEVDIGCELCLKDANILMLRRINQCILLRDDSVRRLSARLANFSTSPQ
jgi:hypothetical protein